MELEISPIKFRLFCADLSTLNDWGQVVHIYASKLTIIALDNGLSPAWCQTII